MVRGDWKDILGGAALIALGGAYLSGALGLDLGTARRMGPGYYPMIVAIVTMIVGVLILVPALVRRDIMPRPRWRPLLLVLGSFATFGLLMRYAGFIPALFMTVIVAALADPNSRPVSTVALAAGATLVAWLIFIAGLGLPIPAFRRIV